MAFGLLPYQEIFLWSVGLSLLMTFMSKFLVNQQEMKKSKREMEFYRDKVSKAQKEKDTKRMSEYMAEMNKASMKQLRLNMKPMLFSLLLFFIAASFFNATYADVKVASPVNIPFLGNELNWVWWYILIVLSTSTIFRKLLDVA